MATGKWVLGRLPLLDADVTLDGYRNHADVTLDGYRNPSGEEDLRPV